MVLGLFGARRLRLPPPEGTPRRIGIDARFLGAGSSGLARYSERLLQALSERDSFNRYVVFVNHRLTRKLKLGDNFTLIPMRGRPLSLAAMMRMARMVQRSQLDLLHVHFPLKPPLVDCPTLVTVHDTMPFSRDHGDFGHRTRPWRMLWTYLLYPLALRESKWVLCVSNATRRALSELFPQMLHKSFVIHSAVDEDFCEPIEEATRQLIEKRLELPGRYLLYSGSARSDKNVQGLLRAFALMHQDADDLEDVQLLLELTGSVESYAWIAKIVEQYRLESHVRIVTSLSEAERKVCFQRAGALVLLSRGEGFGFPVLEAQLSGAPVLAANSGALPEVAGAGGALLVDPDDEDEIARQMGRILRDASLRQSLIKTGRTNAERFDWDLSARQLLEVFELLF